MKVYFVVFFLTLFLSYTLPAKTDKQWRWKLFFTFFPLFVFGALRVDFGNDYESYEMFFDEAHYTSQFIYNDKLRAEFGYQVLCYIMPTFRSMLVLNAFILCLALAVFCYRNVPKAYLWMAVLLIFLNPEKNIYGNLVGMRNGFVVTGFVLGLVLIQRRKLIWFAILTFLLSTLHTSAFLFMPLAYIVGRNTRISEREIAIWICVFIVLLSFSVTGLVELATPIVSRYFDRYEYYLEGMQGHRGFLLTGTSLVLAALVFTLYRIHKGAFSENQNSLIRLGLLYLTSAFLGSLSMRAYYFYDMFFVGTVVTLYATDKNKSLISLALVLLSIITSLYSLKLWMTNQYVAGNPLYQVYTSIFGSL